MLVCYKFDDETHPATTTTLGNVKKSSSLYYRSRPSTLQSIKEKAKAREWPSQVYDEVFEEAEGVLGFQSHGNLPRNRQQASDAKRNVKPKKDKDEMCELIKMSRLEASELKPL